MDTPVAAGAIPTDSFTVIEAQLSLSSATATNIDHSASAPAPFERLSTSTSHRNSRGSLDSNAHTQASSSAANWILSVSRRFTKNVAVSPYFMPSLKNWRL